MTSYILIIALVAGLLMYLLASKAETKEIGRMMLFAAILALLIAVAPATVRLLHG